MFKAENGASSSGPGSMVASIGKGPQHNAIGPLKLNINGPISPLERKARANRVSGSHKVQNPVLQPSFQAQVISGLDASASVWNDIKTLRWLREPSASFRLLCIPIVLYSLWEHFSLDPTNPFHAMLFISHPVRDSPAEDPRYAKGPLDFLFVAYYIIVFSFIRQFFLLKIVYPITARLGLKSSKIERFGEQAYAMLYYGVMGFWGLYIMTTLPTWYYRTENFWIGYPHWDMKPLLKRYYLMHSAYWLQQLIVLVLKIEKPRKDYTELTAHHLVTLWLVGWSYGFNLTLIGNAVFVSMDIPDVFLALSKMCNYLGLQKTKAAVFVFFFGVWTYFRHYLNLVMLWSVWTQFDLIPKSSQRWEPSEGVWMVWWMKYQIFVPMLLLQLLNLFWYYLIWRILIRAVAGTDKMDDVRSDDEGDDVKDD